MGSSMPARPRQCHWAWHRDVHDQDVGIMLFAIQRLQSISRFGGHRQPRLALEQTPQSAPNEP